MKSLSQQTCTLRSISFCQTHSCSQYMTVVKYTVRTQCLASARVSLATMVTPAEQPALRMCAFCVCNALHQMHNPHICVPAKPTHSLVAVLHQACGQMHCSQCCHADASAVFPLCSNTASWNNHHSTAGTGLCMLSAWCSHLLTQYLHAI